MIVSFLVMSNSMAQTYRKIKYCSPNIGVAFLSYCGNSDQNSKYKASLMVILDFDI